MRSGMRSTTSGQTVSLHRILPTSSIQKGSSQIPKSWCSNAGRFNAASQFVGGNRRRMEPLSDSACVVSLDSKNLCSRELVILRAARPSFRSAISVSRGAR